MKKDCRRTISSFFTTIILLFIIQLSFPFIEIKLKFLALMYRQTNYFSSHFDLAKFFSYMTFLICIFICFHPNRIYKLFSKKNYCLLGIWVGIALTVFIISIHTSLLGFYDYENFCLGRSLSIFNLHRDDGIFGYQIFLTMNDLDRIITFKSIYTNLIPLVINEECLYPGMMERLLYVTIFQVLPSYIYMWCFTHKLKKSYLVNLAGIKSLSITEIIFLVCISLYICYHLVFFCFISYIYLLVYLIIYLIIIAVLAYMTFRVNKTKIFLIDKYFIAYFLLPISCLHCGLDTIILSICLSVVLIEKKNRQSFFSFWVDQREIKSTVGNIEDAD